MPQNTDRPSRVSLQAWPRPARWAALLLLSAVFTFVLELAHLPAALFLGPMLAAVLMAVFGGQVRLPKPAFGMGQGVVGVMIAGNMPATIFHEIGAQWPIFSVGIVSILAVSSLLGWLLARTGILPGTTAIWGSAPGAASAMTLMSEGWGADMRLVAFMQYLRVLCCAIAATTIAQILGGASLGTAPEVVWFPAVSPLPVAGTIGIAALGAWLAHRLRMPGGGLLLPLVIGMVVKFSGLMPLQLPPAVLALSYAMIGWGIGMRFTPQVVAHATRAFPRVLGMIVVLIAISGGIGTMLVVFAGIDPLTAYLATSPGGADSIAIISASMPVDVPFVMAMQIGRFLLVLALGPWLAKMLSGRPQRGAAA